MIVRRLFPILLLAALAAPVAGRAEDKAANLLQNAEMTHWTPVSNPWTGFDKDQMAQALTERFLTVDDSGSLKDIWFPPAVDACDFFNQGRPDLLVLDASGYLRYYPNSGTKLAPRFSESIVLPVDLPPSPYGLQIIDVDGDGKPDLVIGDDKGQMYVLKNIGGNGYPHFDSPKSLSLNEVDLRIGGKAWCNFVSPAYGLWHPSTTGLFDLVMGDGTYASDNVYFLRNKGTNDKPKFDERTVLIEGGGRQHLTVRRVKWYGTDEYDLLVGDRSGSAFVYKNMSVDADPVPRFAPGKQLGVANSTRFAVFGRMTSADFNGDGKPDLAWFDPAGHLWYAINAGTAEAPDFPAAVQVKTDRLVTVYQKPTNWTFRTGWDGGTSFPHAGGFFYFLHAVGADPTDPATYEPKFTMPEGSTEKYALKLEFMPPSEGVTETYPPYKDDKGGDGEFILYYSPDSNGKADYISLNDKTRYTVSFNIRGEGFSKVRFVLFGQQQINKKEGGADFKEVGMEQDLSLGTGWQKVEIPFTLNLDPKGLDAGGAFRHMSFSFRLIGKGSFYVTDVAMRQAK